MKIFNNKLIFILLIIIHLFTYFEPNNGCGFPVPQSAPPVCVCGGGGGGGYGCGGGGGGCCGRRKREVIQPHFKGVELPCPQTEWSLIMEKVAFSYKKILNIWYFQNIYWVPLNL
ncbi:unnamed protein product [Meloidogyne enterolobii]|uniref:Uncharacterized protein n=1 Tax=Meloidogyne enterolobii TaxID=390850 RepID=A0ACB0ZRG4_MELEN